MSVDLNYCLGAKATDFGRFWPLNGSTSSGPIILREHIIRLVRALNARMYQFQPTSSVGF